MNTLWPPFILNPRNFQDIQTNNSLQKKRRHCSDIIATRPSNSNFLSLKNDKMVADFESIFSEEEHTMVSVVLHWHAMPYGYDVMTGIIVEREVNLCHVLPCAYSWLVLYNILHTLKINVFEPCLKSVQKYIL